MGINNLNNFIIGIYQLCIFNTDSYEKLAYVNFISFPKQKAEVIDKESKELNATSHFILVKISFLLNFIILERLSVGGFDLETSFLIMYQIFRFCFRVQPTKST